MSGGSMKKLISVSTTLILLFSTIGCTNINEKDNEPTKEEIFHYEVEIISNGSFAYIVKFPTPLRSRDLWPDEGKPVKLMEELEIAYGDANYVINNTSLGYAMEINSNQSMKMIAHREIIDDEIDENDYVFGSLSMQNGNKSYSPYYIFYMANVDQNVLINFSCYWRSIPHRCESVEFKLINYRLEHGWNSVELVDHD